MVSHGYCVDCVWGTGERACIDRLTRRNWHGSCPAFLQFKHGWPFPLSPVHLIFLLRHRRHYVPSAVSTLYLQFDAKEMGQNKFDHSQASRMEMERKGEGGKNNLLQRRFSSVELALRPPGRSLRCFGSGSRSGRTGWICVPHTTRRRARCRPEGKSTVCDGWWIGSHLMNPCLEPREKKMRISIYFCLYRCVYHSLPISLL